MNKRMKLLSLLLAGGVLTAGGLLGAYAGERTTDTFAEQEMTGEMRRMAQQEELPAEEPVSNEGEEAEQVQTDIPEVAENETVLVQSEYADIAVAQVNNYVNVRSEPNTESEILGKLYHNSAATVLEATEDGWYRIKSGNVEGYVKSEYVVVGDEELARAVGTRYATVTTTTLFVRSEPSIEARILTMLPEGDDLEVLDESLDGWALVSTVEGDGYVSKDYVEFSTEYITAESREEEAARLAKEEAERKAAAEAAAAARRAREEEQRKAAAAAQTGSSSAGSSSAGSSSAGSSSAGSSSAG
ncbi:MAG: SH3 domain-containing protein, partial [Clostridiales bacterium]|nr:SH3 domain-containing protein [Clostridiales bacterium]